MRGSGCWPWPRHTAASQDEQALARPCLVKHHELI
jgi:hypothetical protein